MNVGLHWGAGTFMAACFVALEERPSNTLKPYHAALSTVALRIGGEVVFACFVVFTTAFSVLGAVQYRRLGASAAAPIIFTLLLMLAESRADLLGLNATERCLVLFPGLLILGASVAVAFSHPKAAACGVSRWDAPAET